MNVCINLSLYLKVKCGCNEQCSSWIVQRKNTKRGGEKTDLYRVLRHDHVSWRSNHPLLTGHTRRELFVVVGKTGKTVDNSMINNGLTIDMKTSVNIRSSERLYFFDKVLVSTITYEMKSIETVDNLNLSTFWSLACLILEIIHM